MAPRLRRNKAFEILGTTPTNPYWSWCAISPDHRRVIFTLWADEMIGGRNRLSWPDYKTERPNGARDQQRILALVIQHKIPAYGLVCVARDPKATPRSIKEIKADYLIKLQIREIDGVTYGYHMGSVLMAEVSATRNAEAAENDGLRDLDDIPAGNERPDRATTQSWTVIRDPQVRAYVLKHAKGKCEHCGKEGFEMLDGRHYLEVHHVIALAKDGKDTVDNVIALCAEHHREAHYGKGATLLEAEFIKKIAARNQTRH